MNEKGWCIISTPIFGVGFQRLLDKEEDTKISGEQDNSRSNNISGYVDLHYVCAYDFCLFILLWLY